MRSSHSATPLATSMASRLTRRSGVFLLSKYPHTCANNIYLHLNNSYTCSALLPTICSNHSHASTAPNLCHRSTRCMSTTKDPLIAVTPQHADHCLHMPLLSFAAQGKKASASKSNLKIKGSKTLKADSKDAASSKSSASEASETSSEPAAAATATTAEDAKDSKDEAEEGDKGEKNEKDDKEEKDKSFDVDLGKIYEKLNTYSSKTFSTSGLDEEARKLQQEYKEKSEEMRNTQEMAKKKQEEFAMKLESFRNENNFEIKHFTFSYTYDFWVVYLRDKLYNRMMNSAFTQFSARFLSYDEFVTGSLDAFQFVCDCLANEEFDDLSACVSDEILNQGPVLRTAMLGDDQELYKVMPYLYDVKTVRTERTDSSQANPSDFSALSRGPVQIVFVVRYYYCVKPKGVEVSEGNELQYIEDQRFAQFTFSSSWMAKQDSVLTFEMQQDWRVENIDITAMRVVPIDENTDDTATQDSQDSQESQTEDSESKQSENDINESNDAKNESDKK